MKYPLQKFFPLIAVVMIAGSLVFSIKWGVTVFVLPVIIVFLAFAIYYMAILNQREKINKESEKALEENEKHIKTIFNAAPDAVIVINEEGRIIQWNPKAESMFGWSNGEAIGKLLTETIVPLPYREAHQKGIEQFLKNGESRILNQMVEIYACTKTGTDISVALSISPTIVKGKYIFIGFVRDVTEKKAAEERIRESKDIFSTLFYKSPVMNVIADATSGEFVDINDSYASFCGFKREEMIGKTAIELGLLVNPEERVGIIEELTAKTYVRNRELQLQLRDEIKWVSMNIDRLMLFDRPCYLAAVMDITEQKKGEDKFRLLLEAKINQRTAELARKNRDLEQFAYVASHDLQEPLRTTLSFVELLKEKYYGKLDEETDQILAYMVQSNARMKILIKDLLDYSCIGRKIQLCDIDCNTILSEVLADLDTAIKEAMGKIEYGPLPLLRGYSTELKVLFQNLISNALKFRRKDIPLVIKISATRKKNYVEFAVSDNGIGIDDKFRERIFVIFQRLHVHSEYEGSGIGLAHCKKIVELHNGTIWVDSVVGEGSIFYFTIQLM